MSACHSRGEVRADHARPLLIALGLTTSSMLAFCIGHLPVQVEIVGVDVHSAHAERAL